MSPQSDFNPVVTLPQEADAIWEAMYTNEAEAAAAVMAADAAAMEANTAMLQATAIAQRDREIFAEAIAIHTARADTEERRLENAAATLAQNGDVAGAGALAPPVSSGAPTVTQETATE
jgi:hypothetical protein